MKRRVRTYLVGESEFVAASANLSARSLKQKSLCPAGLYDAQAVSRANFVLHSVEVILDGLFGKAEVVGDFLVCQPFGD